LRVGAGAKGKVASALSYGIPVVSTQIGIEGTDIVHDQHVLIADDPAEFAAAVLRVYRNQTLWGRLSKSGQKLVKERFSLEIGKEALASAIETAFAHKLGLDRAADSSASA
jgi:glycosyltransferase involved in cell wall biosynthesis